MSRFFVIKETTNTTGGALVPGGVVEAQDVDYVEIEQTATEVFSTRFYDEEKKATLIGGPQAQQIEASEIAQEEEEIGGPVKTRKKKK
jgi:hypothetical protein